MPNLLSGPQQAAQGVARESAPVAVAAIAVAELTADQPVFHEFYGYGIVTTVEGHTITFRERKDSTVTHTVPASELITKPQAELALEATWNACGFQEYRRRMGKWCSITKNLCRWGEWEGVLKKYNLKRGSMDVLINRFEEEEEWTAHTANLLKFSKLAPIQVDLNEPEHNLLLKVDTTEPATVHSVYMVTGIPQVNERTPDPANDEREKNKLAEIAKRKGVTPTPHRTMLHLQRRNLDPERLARYHAIRDNNKDLVKEITDRKIDEAIDEVLALATQPAPQLVASVLSASSRNVDAARAEVCSALRNLGFSAAEINTIEFDTKLAFNEMMLMALKQLKPDKGV